MHLGYLCKGLCVSHLTMPDWLPDLPFFLLVRLSVRPSGCLSVCLSVCYYPSDRFLIKQFLCWTFDLQLYQAPFCHLREELASLMKHTRPCHKKVTLTGIRDQLNYMIRAIGGCDGGNESSLLQFLPKQSDADLCERVHAVLTNFQTIVRSVVNTSCSKKTKNSQQTKKQPQTKKPKQTKNPRKVKTTK